MDLKDFGTRFEAALVELLTLQDEFFKSGGIEKSPLQDEIPLAKKIDLVFKKRDKKSGRKVKKCEANAFIFYDYLKKEYKETKIQAGAIVCKDMSNKFVERVWGEKNAWKNIYLLRIELAHTDKLIKWENDRDYFILKEDCMFESPSAAATFLVGSSGSRDDWLEKYTKKTLSQIIREP